MEANDIPGVYIRPAQRHDKDRIHQLALQNIALHKTFGNVLLRDNAETRRREKESILHSINNSGSCVLVAIHKGVLVGYIIGSLNKLNPLLSYRRTGSIDDMYIDQSHRGFGFGRSLFDELINWFRKRRVERVGVSVNVENSNAVSVWKRFGFREVVKQMTLTL